MEDVGKSRQNGGDKTLNLQQLFAMSFGLSVENIYYIAIAVLACVLGAEIAGICILIGKMRRARNDETDVQNDEYNGNGRAYAALALSFGAVSATAELALFVLAIAVAAGAVILCLLLAVLSAKGYWLTPAQKNKATQEQPAEEPAEEPQEIPEPVYNSEPVSEQPAQEDENVPAEDYADDVAAQEAIANLIATEDAVLTEEYEEEPAAEESVETVEEAEEVEEIAQAPEQTTEVAVVAEDPNTSVVQSQTVERTVLSEGAPAYAGQAPFVEKHITEITKEVIKETNTTTVNTVTEGKSEPKQQFSPATEEMMKAITEFMKLETQLRMEREVAVERPAQADGESTPAFAEDEELDVDEREEDDELEAEDEAEREADEENDDDYESDLFGGNERIVGFDEETGCYIVARYRKSCEAKLIQARPATKKYYSAIRNALMGYEGTKERMSWTIDTYTNEHTQIAKINVRPRTIDLYLALEPSTLEDSVYRGRDVSNKKKYAETPFLYKVNSPRKLTLALELVQRACEEQGLSPIDIEEVNYEEQYPFTDTETLIVRGLIREYLREEKPAATFELDPDHVPQLAEEDETVIPANANFTWEFDNDQPEVEEPAPEEPVAEEPVIEEEPVPEEEPVIVEEPAEEPVKEAPVAGTTTTTTTHETIRTTERHYTERYYGTGAQAQISQETRTIEVLPEHTATPIEAVAEEIAPEVADEPVMAEQPVEEAVEEPVEEAVEEIEEETAEELADEIVEEEIEEIIEEEAEEVVEVEETAEVQSALAALFGDDVNEEDEPIEEEIVEEEPEVETEEKIVEEEPEVEVEEEYYEEETEAEPEEEYYEEEVEVEPEEEYYEEEVEVEPEEEYYEEEVEEEYYEEEVEVEPEEEYYEEESDEEAQEVYENFEEEEFEESYEEEEPVEEVVEEEAEEAPAPVPAPQPTTDVVLLDVCLFDDYFDNGAIVNLETLKQVGLAPESATRLKVYASGALKGQFTVEAHHFTLDAIKAIGDADGDSIMIR